MKRKYRDYDDVCLKKNKKIKIDFENLIFLFFDFFEKKKINNFLLNLKNKNNFLFFLNFFIKYSKSNNLLNNFIQQYFVIFLQIKQKIFTKINSDLFINSLKKFIYFKVLFQNPFLISKISDNLNIFAFFILFSTYHFTSNTNSILSLIHFLNITEEQILP